MLSRRRFVSSALGTAAARRLVRAQGCSASTSNSISEPTMAQIQSIVEAHLPTVSPYIGAAIGLASPAFGAHIVCIGSLVNQLGNPMAFTTDTPFEIASVTKTATASVYQRLIQNGRINHKETLGRFISREVSDKIRAIPLFDLANYTSGLS
jgi:CubicO group peptidase (beta-lactamase class C family)